MAGKSIEIIDGVPVPVYTPPITRQQLADLIPACLTKPYKMLRNSEGIPLPAELEYDGFTKAEVMIDRLCDEATQGNVPAAKFLVENILGKPEQRTQNVNVNVNPLEWLSKTREQKPIEMARDGKIHLEDKQAIIDIPMVEQPQTIKQLPRHIEEL